MDDLRRIDENDEGMTFAAATGGLAGVLFVLGFLLLYGIGGGAVFPVTHPALILSPEASEPL